MCYCRSVELYDKSNENKEYELITRDKPTKTIDKIDKIDSIDINTDKIDNKININPPTETSYTHSTIKNKPNTQNSFIASNSPHFPHFKSTIDSSLISLPYTIDKIDIIEIQADPLDFYKKYISKGIPCIIKNIARGWPALKKWDDSNYLIEKMGDEKLTIDITPDGFADSIKSDYFIQPYQSKSTLSDFFNKHIKNRDKFISYIQKQNNNLNEEFSNFLDDIPSDINNLFTNLFGTKPDATNIWIGVKESVTAMHKDNYENIFTVIKGEKHFTLIPPVYYPFLRPCYYKDARWVLKNKDNSINNCNDLNKDLNKLSDLVIEKGDENISIPWISVNPDIDEEIVDENGYLKHGGDNFQSINSEIEMKRYHVIIESGDGLYLPPLWYHQVSQFSFTDDVIIGVNYWYDMEYGSNYALYELIKGLVGLKDKTEN